MYKANGKLLDLAFNKKNNDIIIEDIKELKKKFSREGKFELFKHTSSYVEIPPITKTEDSGTFIRRKYRGVELVTLGSTVYFVEDNNLMKFLKTYPRFLYLGSSGLRVVRVDACYHNLNKEGRKFQEELLSDWDKLTKPVFSYRGL